MKVYVDKGYPSATNHAVLKEKKFKLISKSRWVVGRIFESIQKWFDDGRCRYLGLTKTHFQNVLESLVYNLYRVRELVMPQRAK